MDVKQEMSYCDNCNQYTPFDDTSVCPGCNFDHAMGMRNVCPECEGTGGHSIDDMMPCEHCDGEGVEWWL